MNLFCVRIHIVSSSTFDFGNNIRTKKKERHRNIWKCNRMWVITTIINNWLFSIPINRPLCWRFSWQFAALPSVIVLSSRIESNRLLHNIVAMPSDIDFLSSNYWNVIVNGNITNSKRCVPRLKWIQLTRCCGDGDSSLVFFDLSRTHYERLFESYKRH